MNGNVGGIIPANPGIPPFSLGQREAVKKLKRGNLRKMLDYTYDCLLSPFYPAGGRRRFPWGTYQRCKWSNSGFPDIP